MANRTNEFNEAIGALCIAFNRPGTDALFSAYWMGLSDLKQSEIDSACMQAISKCKFMPVPRELRELAGEIPVEQRAILAWDAFIGAVARLGYYRSPDFYDRVINATVRNLGGWKRVCEEAGEPKFETFGRKDFERIYVSLCRSGISIEQGGRLTGEFELQNSASGMLVGDVLKLPGGKTQKWEPDLVATGLPPHRDPRLNPPKAPGRIENKTSGLVQLRKA